MDYGNEVYASTMETRVGVHRNISHGRQPTDSKILQPCGELLFDTVAVASDTLDFVV